MKSTPEPQDPWDKLHDADRDDPIKLPETPQSHEPPCFTKGEIACFTAIGIGVVAGIIILALAILNEMLNLP